MKPAQKFVAGKRTYRGGNDNSPVVGHTEQSAVKSPVEVFSEGKAIGRMVGASLTDRHDMRCVEKR